ncbi:hypothetical protein BCR32DRAFT_327726 [Anaeromyces robustus]|jgi:endo-alpha-1,4-polygalactosaminidase (GH114 family)|uniref:alpha-galactosidase n=1 Tax=Anaeromyces robustus TaxID=1754192 RepID=A0A1Y1X444_9FUNG|nr:hypothetical protein BCR32DRAFT_327726 [Anaeromyces robustus]|eukprot:ORX80425.1 hypothetical protein BCR32DRAFT_327726 [Anaeromyces robustus]
MNVLLPLSILITLVYNVSAKWIPSQDMKWNYILGVEPEEFDLDSENADVLGIGYLNSAETIQKYHDAGKMVICYFSVGTVADYDPDIKEYEAISGLVKTRHTQWPAERWIDFRVDGAKELIINRFKKAKEAGCDGIEPDHLGGYYHDEVKSWSNPLTMEDTVEYAKWLTEVAHDFGFSIGLKNGLGIIDQVGQYFDFAINESCTVYNECKRYNDFLASGKAVFGVSYGEVDDLKDSLCTNLKGYPISMIVKKSNALRQERTFFDVDKYCGYSPNYASTSAKSTSTSSSSSSSISRDVDLNSSKKDNSSSSSSKTTDKDSSSSSKTTAKSDEKSKTSKPQATSTSKNASSPSSYVTIKFKGNLDYTSNFYLGVPELKEYASFDIYKLSTEKSYKYRTWHVTSTDKPSFMYLSTGTYGSIGEPSNYCLDLGEYTNQEGYNYLSIVDCSKASHKFMFGGSYNGSVDIYDAEDNHLKDRSGNKLCLYYSMTPRISKCKNPSNKGNMGWNKFVM